MQMCPACSIDNSDRASACIRCGSSLLGLLGCKSVLQGRYQVLKVLGCGGQGAVYLAEDMRVPGRQVALKENLETSARAVQQFTTEAKVMGKLRHDHLPQVTDVFTEPSGRQYMVMDYIEGKDLEKIVRARGPLPEAEVMMVMSQVFDAVSYLHRQRPPIIHRDIKPKNIIVQPDGKAYLVDFGIAKVGTVGDRTAAWASGMGSPGFAPLEQYSSTGATDQRSDVYALGATLYFLLTGTVPVEASDLASGSKKLSPPRSLNRTIPPTVEQVVLKAMSLTQIQRYASVGELRLALQRSIAAAKTKPSAPISPTAITLATRLVTVLTGHAADVTCVSFSADGQFVAASGGDNAILLWELGTGRLTANLKGHNGQVNCLAFSPNVGFSGLLASGGADNSVIVWDAPQGRVLRSLQGHNGDVRCLAFSPDGRHLASGSSDNTIILWEATGGWMLRTIEGHEGAVVAVAFSSDGKYLASTSGEESIYLWDSHGRDLIRKLKVGGWFATRKHLGEVICLAFSPDATLLACGSSDKSVLVWDVSRGRLIRTLKAHTASVVSVAFSRNGRYLASGSSDNNLILWAVSSGKLVRVLKGHTAGITSVAFSSDGKYLASGSADATVRLWELAEV